MYVKTPRQDEDGTVLGDDGSWLQCYCEDGKGRRIPVRTLYGKEWNVSVYKSFNHWGRLVRLVAVFKVMLVAC